MKKKLFLLFLIAAFGLTGFSCGKKLTPDQVMNKMNEAMVDEAQSFNFTSSISLETEMPPLGRAKPSGKPVPTEIAIDSNGKVDITETGKPKFETMTNGQILSEGISINAAADFKLLEDSLYFRVRQLPSFLPLNIQTGQWFYQSVSKTKEQKRQELSAQDLKTMRELWKNHQIIKVTEDLGEEKINNVKSHHYKIALDRQGAINYMEDLAKARNEQVTEKMKKDFNELLDKLEKMSGEIWIGKKKYFVRKLSLNMPLPVEDREIQTNIDINFNDYNSDIEIIEPKDAKEYKSQMPSFDIKK